MNVLRHYQEEGSLFLAGRKCALLADEPGLGKTVQVIEAINRIGANKCLIICPASVKISWARHLETWLKRPKKVQVIRSKEEIDRTADIYVVNYDLLLKRHVFEVLTQKSYAVIVCDEAHMLKNMDAKRTKAVLGSRGLVHNAVYKWMVTGTPVLNRPVELFPMLLVLARELIKPYDKYYDYVTHFCAAYLTDYGLDVRGSSNLLELSQRLNKFMLRRLKEDVETELPEREYQVIELEYDGNLPVLSEAENLGEIATFRKRISEIKYELAVQHIKMMLESIEKVIVFAHHKDFIERLTDDLSSFNPVVVHGGINMDRRQEAVDMFQKNLRNRVFIGQIQAAGTGITLTAASTVIFAELSWSPEELKQCVDRAHRIGQTKSVLAQFLVVKDSMEANMLNTVLQKVKVIKQIYGGGQ